jgi:hypothetical protein
MVNVEPHADTPTRRPQRRWRLLAVLAAGVYLILLVGATRLAFTVASYMREVTSSPEFQRALRAAQHPFTEADLARLLPGIPIYPGAKLDPMYRTQMMAESRRGVTVVHLVASASPSQIRDFYRTHMSGWEFSTTESGAESLAFSRGLDEFCFITIMPKMPFGIGRGQGFSIRHVRFEGGPR